MLPRIDEHTSDIDRAMDGICPGECCDDIGLEVSPEQLWASYENLRFGMPVIPGVPNIADILTIYPMLEFLWSDHEHPDGNVDTGEAMIYHYRCSEHDPHTGGCRIYGRRPGMCRRYNESGGQCGYECGKALDGRCR